MQKFLHKWRLVLLLTLISCLNSIDSFSQLSFSFTSVSGTWNAISGTTVFTNNEDDRLSSNLFLGFTFYYAGGAYSDFRVSTNGWLSLGNNTTNTLNSNALTTTGNGPIIAPLWDDLWIPGGGLTYAVTGTTGSRILTVQWNNARWNYNANGAVISFQVKLYEGTNIIEFIYDQNNKSVNNGSASIGINGGVSATDFYSVSGLDGSAVATYGSETNWLYQKPEDGRTYRWTPNNMTYVSSTTGQITANVSKCNTQQQGIISVQVVTKGVTSPINLTQMKFDIVTTAVANLTGIHVYYTGDASGFAPANELGGATITPVSTTITVNGTQKLVPGTNYFWIAYDISPTAVVSQTLDARCTEITVAGTAYAPSVTNPPSWRTIVACSPAPGGITGASFWVKADAGTSSTTDNTRISSWNDQSGNARHATNGTANNQPRYRNTATKNMNFNPVVDFDEAAQATSDADFMDITSNGVMSTASNPYEVYAVIVPGANNLTTPGKFLFAGEAGMNKFNSFDVRSGYSVNDSWNMNDQIVSNVWTTDMLSMFTFDYNYSRRETFRAGTSLGTQAGFGRIATNMNNALGYQKSGNLEFYDGGIAEIITYANTSHGTTTREKVETYLGIKYGVTLGHNYRASDNTIVWNVATNAAYNNNIIGIARDDNGALLQKQSRSTSTNPDIMTIYIGPSETVNQATNTGTFTAGDKSYFIVGHNNGLPYASYTVLGDRPTGICCRIGREWLVQKTNFTNTDVKLKFNFDAITPGYVSLNTSDLRLLVDADGDFTNATILTTPTISITTSGGVAIVTVPASVFNSTPYLTLGSISTNTSLPLVLKSFSGLCREQTVQVKWTTATNVIGDFSVERSSDKVNFSAAGTVKPNASGNYVWTDQSPLPGTIYYRLKTVNENGMVLYSPIITVNSCNTTSILLSTNAVTNESTLMLQLSQNSLTEITLFDLMGRRSDVAGLTGKRSMEKGVHYIPVNIPGTVAGMYLLHVVVNGERHVYRIIKK
ncbi:hypothetical protein D3H65_07125 [Paraflavitalea soli]|uniref:Uncharacterized protein n=1 Tax=Paraflavitalea soli TaxID=2315862 RepID=A0A3B7MTD8_9BACT|nr:BNR-repeat neuraminidase N-terminal domain-containing protein [Paraflavitalea soli]AXY73761.1 hypothetical protein D3H65_07125 [Paraflavitalea soli]